MLEELGKEMPERSKQANQKHSQLRARVKYVYTDSHVGKHPKATEKYLRCSAPDKPDRH